MGQNHKQLVKGMSYTFLETFLYFKNYIETKSYQKIQERYKREWMMMKGK